MGWLVFYGGAGEVGGNKILLEDGDVRVFLDFGISFTQMGKFYSAPFRRPRREEGLVELGLIPPIKGVYNFDKAETSVDAVIVSHVHMDHVGFLPLIRDEIPVFCGETAATMLDAFTGMEKWIVGRGVRKGSVRTFRTNDGFRVGGVEVRPVHVDHSVPGSYGFVIHTSEGTVAYTGDFRTHGARSELTMDFVSAAEGEGVDVLIVEATNISNAYVSSEGEVREKLHHIVNNTDGLVVTYFASTDIDRLRTFYEVAERSGRKLILSAKQAYLLSKLEGDPHLRVPSLRDKCIMVFKKKKKVYKGWEREVLEGETVVEAGDISKMQREAILIASLYDFEELIEVKPAPGSCYIYSSSEPFNEEMEIDFNKTRNWLEHYGLPQYHVHVSGHIMPVELKKVVERIKPKRVFPVHCEQPEVFAKFIKGIKTDTIIPLAGERYTV
ncbi:MAG: MBL fold metallo-hydrolase [Candidatus Freyarchaeota archaeon]|nr:MBL fold metallo-hydrolase [Candidatus Jordarchaeia archaeon]